MAEEDGTIPAFVALNLYYFWKPETGDEFWFGKAPATLLSSISFLSPVTATEIPLVLP
jgi:hypothetical protein